MDLRRTRVMTEVSQKALLDANASHTKRDDVMNELGLIRLGHSTHTPRMAPIVIVLMEFASCDAKPRPQVTDYK
jgi:hypothetical protein